MRAITVVALLAALCATATAQTQLVRGKVEDVRNAPGQFVLDCTNVPLVSKALDLRALVGQQWNLWVVDVGSRGNPVLDVRAADAVAKIMDMGNLRFGRDASWRVLAAPGSSVWVFVEYSGNTTWIPLGPMGSWLLGGAQGGYLLQHGVSDSTGGFSFRFTMPTMPQLVGLSFTSQAVVFDLRELLLTNPDCKEVRDD